MDMRCRITSGGCKPRESATENGPPLQPVIPFSGNCRAGAVRVKRCGKSAPRRRQRRRHGKPHREQDRIGTVRDGDLRASLCPGIHVRIQRRPGRLLQAPSNRGRRGMAVTRGRFPPALQNPAYRPADNIRGPGGKRPPGPPVFARSADRASMCPGCGAARAHPHEFFRISGRECAKRCAADPGPPQARSLQLPALRAVPGLQRIMSSALTAHSRLTVAAHAALRPGHRPHPPHFACAQCGLRSCGG
jgi:hypothetical protein